MSCAAANWSAPLRAPSCPPTAKSWLDARSEVCEACKTRDTLARKMVMCHHFSATSTPDSDNDTAMSQEVSAPPRRDVSPAPVSLGVVLYRSKVVLSSPLADDPRSLGRSFECRVQHKEVVSGACLHARVIRDVQGAPARCVSFVAGVDVAAWLLSIVQCEQLQKGEPRAGAELFSPHFSFRWMLH